MNVNHATGSVANSPRRGVVSLLPNLTLLLLGIGILPLPGREFKTG